jgi:UDP-glucose 4-epimerase
MTQRIAVTGASGYIGRATVNRLTDQGHEVIALTRRLSAHHAAGAGIWLERAEGLPLAADLVGCGAVIHLAGRAHTNIATKDGLDLFNDANHRLALDCSVIARDANVASFVLVSTLGVHGNWSNTPISEHSLLQGNTPYARSKIAGEQAVTEALHDSATRLCIVRPPMVYGPACPGNFTRLVKLIRTGLPLPFRSVTSMRSFIHISNLTAFLARCALTSSVHGTYVIADGSDFALPTLIRRIGVGLQRPTRLVPCSPVLLRALARLIGKQTELDSLTRPMCVDWSRARAGGWSPPIPPDTALADTVGAYAPH